MTVIDPDAPLDGGATLQDHVTDAYSAAVDAAVDLDRLHAPIDAQRAELVEISRRQAMSIHDALVDPSVSARSRRLEAAARAHQAVVAIRFRISVRQAAILIAESQTLVSDLPQTLQAMKSGQVGYQAARHAIEEADSLPVEARARFDEEAAALASRLTPTQTKRRLRALRERMHPESITERRVRCETKRSVWLQPERDGMATLGLYLPAEDATAAYERIDRVARSLKKLGDEDRTLAQLRADAATALLHDGDVRDDRPDGQHPRALVPYGIRPTVMVTVPVLTLLGVTERPATLDGYGPIDPETARRLAAKAPTFLRLLTDPHTGAVLSAEKRPHDAPADLRRALIVRDQTCREPGCNRPARTSELDHTVEWQHGGETSADNLAHLCAAHHHLRHDTRWTITNLGNGVLRWTDPTGRSYTSHPEPIDPPLPEETEMDTEFPF